MKYIQKIKSFSKKTLLLILGIIAGATFSVYAAGTWHGTDWIQTGEVISAQKIKDNFDYLYENGGGGGGGAIFTSPELTLSRSGKFISVAHGLGKVPTFVQTFLINKVAELGYEPGDIILYTSPTGTAIYKSHYGIGAMTIISDTHIKVEDRPKSVAITSVKVINGETFSGSPEKVINYSKWKLIVSAI